MFLTSISSIIAHIKRCLCFLFQTDTFALYVKSWHNFAWINISNYLELLIYVTWNYSTYLAFYSIFSGGVNSKLSIILCKYRTVDMTPKSTSVHKQTQSKTHTQECWCCPFLFVLSCFSCWQIKHVTGHFTDTRKEVKLTSKRYAWGLYGLFTNEIVKGWKKIVLHNVLL